MSKETVRHETGAAFLIRVLLTRTQVLLLGALDRLPWTCGLWCRVRL